MCKCFRHKTRRTDFNRIKETTGVCNGISPSMAAFDLPQLEALMKGRIEANLYNFMTNPISVNGSKVDGLYAPSVFRERRTYLST